MKKFLLILILLLIFSRSAAAQNSSFKFDLNYGYGGEYESHSFGMQIINRDDSGLIRGFGVFSISTDSDYDKPGRDDLPSNHQVIGSHVSSETGLYFILGRQLTSRSSIRVNLGGSIIEETEVLADPDSGSAMTFKGAVDTEYFWVYGAEISFGLTPRHDLALGYNNRRGLTTSIALSF
ncbi:hypothetical protein [Halanaerobium hydrogeniformans]|uniref:Outer membrane protein beta-barrel domain-containing protein n=1 Tax=Halanaerobium hydrogeniformans TaxID=656519 RepID=E4RP10_HALHG|nr:hypothetical protein [Halanaerobium hydrogeniformans]ADQ13700.1 hypothetical protein Halsa_0213 [Halanaerobium hydrogeniformans]